MTQLSNPLFVLVLQPPSKQRYENWKGVLLKLGLGIGFRLWNHVGVELVKCKSG